MKGLTSQQFAVENFINWIFRKWQLSLYIHHINTNSKSRYRFDARLTYIHVFPLGPFLMRYRCVQRIELIKLYGWMLAWIITYLHGTNANKGTLRMHWHLNHLCTKFDMLWVSVLSRGCVLANVSFQCQP